MPFCLTAPPTPTLFGVFAFHHRWSPFITGVSTPSIRCLYNSSSFHPCMHWKGPHMLTLSRAQETSCCTQLLHSLYSEFHLRTFLLFAPVVSLQYLIGSHRYSYTISVCHRAIYVLQILPILCLYLTAAHPVTTPVQVKIGCQSLSPCCISLPFSGSLSFSPREITVTESNFFREITTPSNP